MEATTLKGNELVRWNAKQGGAPRPRRYANRIQDFRQQDRTSRHFRLFEPEQTFSSSTGM